MSATSTINGDHRLYHHLHLLQQGQKQEQQLARSAEDGDQHDRDGDSDNESVSTLIPSEGGVGPPAGLGEEATSR